MTLEETLNEIKERTDAATEGPWVEGAGGDVQTKNKVRIEILPDAYVQCIMDLPLTKEGRLDRAFIAHARADVPMLLEMVDYLIQNSRPLGASNDIRNFKGLKSDLEKIAKRYI